MVQWCNGAMVQWCTRQRSGRSQSRNVPALWAPIDQPVQLLRCRWRECCDSGRPGGGRTLCEAEQRPNFPSVGHRHDALISTGSVAALARVRAARVQANAASPHHQFGGPVADHSLTRPEATVTTTRYPPIFDSPIGSLSTREIVAAPPWSPDFRLPLHSESWLKPGLQCLISTTLRPPVGSSTRVPGFANSWSHSARRSESASGAAGVRRSQTRRR
jgi:hypothetical protein